MSKPDYFGQIRIWDYVAQKVRNVTDVYHSLYNMGKRVVVLGRDAETFQFR